MDPEGKGLEQLTFHKEFDMSSPSLHDGRIVYQIVSDLHVYDIAARSARFFPDGRSLMVLSDESGEWEFSRVPANGLGTPERLTTGAKVLRFDGLPSPDGRRLAFADKDNQLWLCDIEKKSLRKVAVSGNGLFGDLAWSPDSRWLTYVQAAGNQFSRVMLLNVEAGDVTGLSPSGFRERMSSLSLPPTSCRASRRNPRSRLRARRPGKTRTSSSTTRPTKPSRAGTPSSRRSSGISRSSSRRTPSRSPSTRPIRTRRGDGNRRLFFADQRARPNQARRTDSAGFPWGE